MFHNFYNFLTPKKEFFFAERTRGYIANIGPSCECASMIKMHLNSIRSDLLCTGPTSDACKESRPQPTSQIDDVTGKVRTLLDQTDQTEQKVGWVIDDTP